MMVPEGRIIPCKVFKSHILVRGFDCAAEEHHEPRIGILGGGRRDDPAGLTATHKPERHAM